MPFRLPSAAGLLRAIVATLVCLGARPTPLPSQEGRASTRPAPAAARALRPEADDRAGTRLGRGDYVVRVRNRLFFIPEEIVDGLKINPTVGVHWAATDRLRVTLDAQTVDNSGPGVIGAVRARRVEGGTAGSGNFAQELALEVGADVWGDPFDGLSLGLTASASRGRRSWYVSDVASDAVLDRGIRSEVVPALSTPVRVASDSWTMTIAPTLVFFPSDNALYVRTLPGRGGKFGTNVGPSASLDVAPIEALQLWVRAFYPFVGYNSLSRGTGEPVRTAVFDAGVRLGVSDAVAAEVFVSNSLGNTGALAYVADREYRALGTGIVFSPGGGHRLERESERIDDRAPDALAFPLVSMAEPEPREVESVVGGGGQGLLAALRVGAAEDLQVAVYLDHIAGVVDESELGVLGSLRLLDEDEGAMLGARVVATVARTNNVFVNLLEGDRIEFRRRGYTESGFSLGDENELEGKVYLVTLALPISRTVSPGVEVWAAPTVSVAQRKGRQGGGVLTGLAARRGDLSLGAELGVPAWSPGNALDDDGRRDDLAWALRAAWAPERLRGAAVTAWLTNEVGASPFHTLRVRDGNRPTLGAALRLRTP